MRMMWPEAFRRAARARTARPQNTLLSSSGSMSSMLLNAWPAARPQQMPPEDTARVARGSAVSMAAAGRLPSARPTAMRVALSHAICRHTVVRSTWQAYIRLRTLCCSSYARDTLSTIKADHANALVTSQCARSEAHT